MDRGAYIKSIAVAVQTAAAGTHLFPSVMIAQAVLEGGNGESVLAKKYNNHFGIKALPNWKGGTVVMSSAEYENGKKVMRDSTFRTYPTLADGFKDRISFLQSNSRYTRAGVFAAKTPQEQTHALQAAGYATDPRYSIKLNDLIAEFKLGQYDQPASATLQPTTEIKKK